MMSTTPGFPSSASVFFLDGSIIKAHVTHPFHLLLSPPIPFRSGRKDVIFQSGQLALSLKMMRTSSGQANGLGQNVLRFGTRRGRRDKGAFAWNVSCLSQSFALWSLFSPFG